MIMPEEAITELTAESFAAEYTAPAESTTEDEAADAQDDTEADEATLEDGEQGEELEAEAEDEADGEDEDDGEDGDQEQPVFDPPARWSAVDKEKFGALDADSQKILLDLNGLQDRDFTRKTQEVAEIRKAAESERDSFASERQAVKQDMEILGEYLASVLPAAPTQQDWATDPVKATQMKAFHDQAINDIALLKDRAGQLGKHDEADQQRVTEQQNQEAARFFDERMPEWKDPKVFKSDMAGMSQIMASEGFTNEEIAGNRDHRNYPILRDAYKWRQLQGKTQATKAKVAKAPKVTRPGKPPKHTSSKDKLKTAQLNYERNANDETFVALQAAERSS